MYEEYDFRVSAYFIFKGYCRAINTLNILHIKYTVLYFNRTCFFANSLKKRAKHRYFIVSE